MFQLFQILLKEDTRATVFAKITAVYLSADGTYLYDVHKIIDSYTRLKVKQSELEYLHGYSSNDWEGYVLEPRQGSENT